jgi:hypothetical protein
MMMEAQGLKESGSTGKKFPAATHYLCGKFPTSFQWHGVFIPERLHPYNKQDLYENSQARSKHPP